MYVCGELLLFLLLLHVLVEEWRAKYELFYKSEGSGSVSASVVNRKRIKAYNLLFSVLTAAYTFLFPCHYGFT